MRRVDLLSIVLPCVVAACAIGGPDNLSSTQNVTFEEFRDNTYKETWEGGLYIVDGDTPIVDDKALYEFWEAQQQGALIINRVGQSDDRWTDTQKLNLTYCVSNNFGTNKQAVIDALKRATEDIGWETMAAVNFIYLPAQDGNCTASNSAVVFPVRQVTNQPYLARAFFPAQPKWAREVLVDSTSFQPGLGWPLANILGHELGHSLGFRHEHTRPEAGTCFEDNSWRALTPYDSKSIMHYPQCNGGSNALNWSALDQQGVSSLYGAPGSGGGGGTTGTAKHETKSGQPAQGEIQQLGAFTVVAGTTFSVVMEGSGDPDLYLRWDAAPTTTVYNCRPYVSGASEQCVVTVPAGTTTANLMVRGYTAAVYALDINYTAP